MKEVVYMPYVLDCSGTYINGIKVWDKRWYWELENKPIKNPNIKIE